MFALVPWAPLDSDLLPAGAATFQLAATRAHA
jgi:hypothetical protein